MHIVNAVQARNTQDVESMLVKRRRRWTNVKPTLNKPAGMSSTKREEYPMWAAGYILLYKVLTNLPAAMATEGVNIAMPMNNIWKKKISQNKT